MRIAIGYRWYANSPVIHFERALQALGHTVSYVGLPDAERLGYDSTVPIGEIFAHWPQPPDLYLWIDSPGRYFPPGIENLSIPTACYVADVHLGQWRKQVARFFDVVFVAERDYLDEYRRAMGHEQVYWWPLCISPEIHYNMRLPRIYDVGFVGHIVRAHRNTPRARLLAHIAERFHTNDFFRSYTLAEVNQVYNQSRIVYNTSISGGVTMRIFEGAACGAMVLTDTRSEALGDLFENGRELVTYADERDLFEKIAYYLAHDAERERIAEAGCQRTHSQHTYARRAQSLLDAVTAPTFQRLAPLRRAGARQRMAARREVYIHLHMLDALLDAARAAGYSPWRRWWAALPCLVRRLLI